MKKSKFWSTVIGLIILIIALAIIAACIGQYSTNPFDVINAILSKLGVIEPVDPSMEIVLFTIRLPRITAAIFIGAMLSVSGTVYQATFKNPLVSPDLLGVSSGATVGAALAILLGFNLLFCQLFAFAFGLLAVFLTTQIPRLIKNTSNLMMILSGIIVGGFLSSILTVMKFVAEGKAELSSIVFWQMGSIASIKTSEVLAIAPVAIICITVLILLSWRLNILSFGETEAKTLGVNVKELRGIIIICASLLTASAVSISGTVGWVGLVIPHLGRLITGSDNTKLIPVAALLGALFMLLIDTVARALFTLEIPLSILTGLIGAPCYLWLLYRQKSVVL